MLICKLIEVSFYMYLFSLLYVPFTNKVDYTRNIRHSTGLNVCKHIATLGLITTPRL